jgi:hypothetical protein
MMILAMKCRYKDRIIREVRESGLQPNKMNREDGFCLSRLWEPPIYTIKEWKKVLCKDKASTAF